MVSLDENLITLACPLRKGSFIVNSFSLEDFDFSSMFSCRRREVSWRKAKDSLSVPQNPERKEKALVPLGPIVDLRLEAV